MPAEQLLPANFEDSAGSAADVRSSWINSVVTAEAQGQTEPIPTRDRKLPQEPIFRDLEVQTETIEDHAASQEKPLVNQHFVESAELTNFLLQSTTLLEEQLLRNVTSTAFDGHDVSWEEQYDQVECIHALKHHASSASGSANPLAFESCTAVAWNASGSVIAAAYGPFDRNDWPMCESMLCTWSILRRKIDPNKADNAVQLQDCLTSLAFHPTDPSLLAGGSFNGDVLLWKLGNEDDLLIAKSVLTAYTHHEPVMQIEWTRMPKSTGYAICTVSADGKLLLWDPQRMSAPIMGFRLPAPKTQRSLIEGGVKMVEGGVCIAFSHEDPTTFVLGLEAGELAKCSLIANEQRSAEFVRNSKGEVPWTLAAAGLLTNVESTHYMRLKQRIEKEARLAQEREVLPRSVFAAEPEIDVLFRSPIIFSYESHSGPVYGAHFSPFHRNVFVSVSTDSSARIFNMLQPKPVHVTEPCSSSLFACSWSPVRPLVFAVAAADGHLYLYDLKRNKGRPEVALKVTTNRSPVYCVAFNPKSPELVATADAQGFVKIWRLSEDFSTMADREQEVLDKLASSASGTVHADGEEEAVEEGDDDEFEEEEDDN